MRQVMNESTIRYRIGVDVGGTFTDIVLMSPEGRAVPKKVLDWSNIVLERAREGE